MPHSWQNHALAYASVGSGLIGASLSAAGGVSNRPIAQADPSMKIGTKLAGCTALALGLAHAVMVVAAPRVGGSPGQAPEPADTPDHIKLFLADPELGIAGRITATDGAVIYFQTRPTIDPETGAPSAVGVRIVDAEARTLVTTGGSSAGDVAIPVKEAMASATLLGELSAGLAEFDLHPALSVQKAALADAVGRSAARSPFDYPLVLEPSQVKAAAGDTGALVDFYLAASAGIELARGEAGMLKARFGDGLGYESAQFFRADEENEDGEPGRIDVYSRVLDRAGRNLGAEFGGDWVPEGWDDVLAAQAVDNRIHDGIASDMGAAAMALNALALGAKSSYGVAFSSELELASMQRLARALAENLLPQRDEGVVAAGEVVAKATGRYRTAIQVHKKWLVWPTEHSATRVYQHLFTTATSSTYSVTATINFCNHGTCAGGSGMSQKCSYTGPRMGSYRLPQSRFVPAGQTGAGTRHTCSSNYGVAGVNNHNCHDDSYVQVRAIRGLSYTHDGGRCKDWDFWATAPGCS